MRKMSTIESLIEHLASTTVEESDKGNFVSFAGPALKLDTEADAFEIVKAINSCSGMKTLELRGNTLGIPAAKAIAKALKNQPHLKNALWKFTRTVDEIPQALSILSSAVILSSAKLVVLDLSDNAFGTRGLIGIVKLLESSSCYTLQELHLNNNGLGIQGAKMLADTMCKCIENSQRDGNRLQLKVFVCGRNRLENEGAIAVARFFKMLETLESVAMPQNRIYAPGIKALAESFTSNGNLQVINLEDNSLTEEGAKCIAGCLPSLKKINMLNFGDCLIRTDGALILADALNVSCPQLRELYLGFNEINKEGGKAIVDALEKKPELEIVVLNGNLFGFEGCDMIQSRMTELGLAKKLGTLSEDEGEEKEDDDVVFVTEINYGQENPCASDKAEKKIHHRPLSKSIRGEENEDDDVVFVTEINCTHEDPNKSVEAEKRILQSQLFKSTPGEFFSKPTTASLISLQKAKENLLSVLPDEPNLADYLDLFSKICSVVKPEDDSARLAACSYADDILSRAIKLCCSEIGEFNNEFFVCLGFLKGESKKPRKKLDVSGALLVLQHAVKQSYFPKSTRDSLQFFLSRPLNCVTACEKAKHCLMQALHEV